MARHARPVTRDDLVTRYTRALNTNPDAPGRPFTFAQVWDAVERLTDEELRDRVEVAEAIETGPPPAPSHRDESVRPGLTTIVKGLTR
jgi:hypothetical protein